jgi:transposase
LINVAALFQNLTDALVAKEAVLAEKEFNIPALTYELAYYKRLRFGTKASSLDRP